jgi:hypothetical protein
MCADGVLTATEGRLDQSGATYLPTTIWSCNTCGCARYESATRVAWRSLETGAPDGSEAASESVAERRAA